MAMASRFIGNMFASWWFLAYIGMLLEHRSNSPRIYKLIYAYNMLQGFGVNALW